MQERSILMPNKKKFKVPYGSKDWKEWEKKRILKSRRRRESKKPLNAVGFEYKKNMEK